jgi:Ohr subfamily peroxiredoxin
MDRVLYTVEAVVEGGRAGHGRTTDGRLDVQLSVPVELSGDGGSGTNPEQLFAVGYAACFQSALLGVARGRNLDALIRASSRASGSVRPDTVASRWPSRSTSMRRNCQPS